MPALTPKLVHEVLTRFFPAKNDNSQCAYVEELQELNDFGIETEDQLASLLQKRTDEIIEIDRSPMTELDIRLYSECEGAESVAKRLREGFWCLSRPASDCSRIRIWQSLRRVCRQTKRDCLKAIEFGS